MLLSMIIYFKLPDQMNGADFWSLGSTEAIHLSETIP